MSSLLPDRRQVNVRALFEATLAEAHSALMHAMSRRMTHLLNQAVEQRLGREPYERRQRVAEDIEGGECQRCHSRRSQDFSRNGGRRRTAGIWWGHLPVRWPAGRLRVRRFGSAQSRGLAPALPAPKR